MALRTDLAIEHERLAPQAPLPQGVTREKRDFSQLTIEEITVETPQGAEALGKPQGRYITITLPPFSSTSTLEDAELSHLGEVLRELLPKEGTILVVGLGNTHITPDAVGPKTVDLILATRHITSLPDSPLAGFRSVAALAPGVLGQTGVETAEIIAGMVEEIAPQAVIAIDAMAASSAQRLGRTIQLSDTGISPGAGVQNRRKELTSHTLGIPVIGLGIPTVVDSQILLQEQMGDQPIPQGEPLMMTPRDVDLMVDRGAKTLAMMLNLALQPQLSPQDILYLTC